jgi:selenocysteine-specific elongation factor
MARPEGNEGVVAAPRFVGVVGTAGHVDHGKTTLVRALTGVDTDRLPEERRRGISIDLGFAPLELPDGRAAGVVDVPGHERFIKNMVAGASGIDVCLLVVAADEGVMPQTREHLDIAWLLGVRQAVVALSKVDLVEPEWLDLVQAEVAELLEPTPLRGAPVVAVSARTGQGLDALRHALAEALERAGAHQDRGFARLPIDRVFTVPGFGTVATGTLTSGSVAVEDRLELLPAGEVVRVRGLQVHGRPVPRAQAGQRVAVNLAGVPRERVRRGDVLATPGSLAAEVVAGVHLQLLRQPGEPLVHGQRVHVHTGTAEAVGRVVLLEDDALQPGEAAFAELRLERPVPLGRGDRFIVRRYSPVTTLGGGVILDVGRRHRRRDPEVRKTLAILHQGSPEEVVEALLAQAGVPVAVRDLARAAGAPAADVASLVGALAARGRAVALGEGPSGWAAAPEAWRRLVTELGDYLRRYHEAHPLRTGVPKEELRQALLPGMDPRAAVAVFDRLVREGAVEVADDRVALPGFAPALPAAWAGAAAAFLAALEAEGLTPPPADELLATVGAPEDPAARAELLAYLEEHGALVRAGPFCFARGAAAAAAEAVRVHLRAHGTITVAELRDLLGVTRRHAVPLAEYFDRAHLTRREGDVRRLA